MELIPENVILAEFWKKYYRRPDGWRMYSGITTNGYPELFITGDKESWLIRRDSMYNGKQGIGGKLEGDIMMNPRVNHYGFRELPIRLMDKMLNINNDDTDQEEKAHIIADLLEKPPTTLDRIRSPGVIRGPMIQSPHALPLISKEQVELDRKLNIEMNKWKRRISYLQ